jgi:single-strand DNA-binding protein
MANDLNSIVLVARLVRDMETKFTSGGLAIGSFSIAVGKRVKKGESWEDYTSFFDCKCFGKTAENLAQYMVKGKQVAITGELNQDRWTKDGETKSRVVINCNTIQLLGGKSDGHADAPPPSTPPRTPASAGADDVPPDFVDDPPF